MSKIMDTLSVIQAGARNNKYRIVYSVSEINTELDIVCNASSMPQREMGTVEVFVKGRKYILAGEIEDTGEWEMTIYNTPDHMLRRFFLELISAIHSYESPAYLLDPGQVSESDLRSIRIEASASSSNNSSVSQFTGFLSSVGSTVQKIDKAITSIGQVFKKAAVVSNTLKNGNIESLVYGPGFISRPWYQQDIIIQQLDHEERPIVQAKLLNAFITNVGPVDFTDEVGDISTTTLTFAYSGVEYQDVGIGIPGN